MTRVILVVGHRLGDQGAENKNSGITEYEYNNTLAKHIKSIASGIIGLDIQIVYRRDAKGTYKYVPADVNGLHPDYIISLHCNAYKELDGQKEVSGGETLYYHKSKRSKLMAGILQKYLNCYIGNKDRGIKPRRTKDQIFEGSDKIMSRGGHILRYTNAPCTISEPVFIDTDDDIARATIDVQAFAMVHIEAIKEIIERV